MVRRAALLLLALAACRFDDATGAPDGFPRTVVDPARPLSLDNPQEDTVTWPLWGGAFRLEGPVVLRTALQAEGPASLLIAGPGAPRQRFAVELAWTGDEWLLRERDGRATLQEIPIRDPGLVTIEPAGASVLVTVDDSEHTFVPSTPPAELELGLYVSLEPGSHLAITDLALSAPLPSSEEELGVPLRELAAARGLSIGSAVDIWPPRHDLGFEAMLGEQFATAAPTELYWATTRGEDEDFFTLPADLVVNYAAVHEQRVTGMFLVWDFELPRWIRRLARTDPDRLGDVLDEHIATLVGRYAGEVDAWVVVNEAIWGPEENGGGPAEWADTLWYGALGAEHIERAFRAARAADPAAVLLYNETGAEALGPKSDFMFGMASDFVARDVPIDAIGLQFHVDAAAPPDMRDVRANMRRFTELGLEVHITELDVSMANLAGSEEENLEVQADVYRDVVEACLAVSGCTDITVFGFSDRYAWDELGDAAPLLFDSDYRPKAAFFAVQSALE